ncbi:hypothetical protein [Oryza sativa Japonica Group]|uniref:Uncharacterized protein n=1 Tax=Oryza sativa subsp. japonica TaxID=39947 RepID=Q5NA92_ORYSJ|nr:hypothetical protein [Oryza sativa Japonica Group]BAE95811.1 hypothetical protein [Oryza sativa Japonica Group]
MACTNIRFAVVAGGAVVISDVSFVGLSYATVFFACAPYVPLVLPEHATTLDIRLVAFTAVMLTVDVTAIGFLEWRSRREMPKPRGTRASASEIVTSFL